MSSNTTAFNQSIIQIFYNFELGMKFIPQFYRNQMAVAQRNNL